MADNLDITIIILDSWFDNFNKPTKLFCCYTIGNTLYFLEKGLN
jgi:hypothetical protein